MHDWNPKANDIFLDAAEIHDPLNRNRFLQEKCAGDQELHRQVQSLLNAREATNGLLEDPAICNGRPPSDLDSDQTAEQVPLPKYPRGAMIGCYKILQEIGEGGFGLVYMAEQQEPLRRKVALKIIKPGMDTRDIIARFEAERQALALMDHPNIAKVLDAGATESGQPYFVMELVRGVPVTEFCDKNRLDTNDRLRLFTAVCHAVQHAHQKGIIHRDLKPSNVMVTLNDGQPMAKVIDFGVAKAINRELTDKTLFTAYGQMIGTPQYMSPEQAEMSAFDIDTRSDIYSLGVLLYELLTGTTPLDSARLRASGYAEMQRLIREENPPKPSLRLSTLGDQLTTVAQNRQTDPAPLCELVRGDLDWIVMKSLEKDRNRRYASATAFAEDITRHLNHEQVMAVAPTFSYRCRKFYERNKTLVRSVMALVLVLVSATIFSSWQAVRAQRNATDALVARTAAEKAGAAAQAARAEEEQQRRQAEAREAEVTRLANHRQRQIYALDMYRASRYLEDGNLRAVRTLLHNHLPEEGQEDLRGFEWRYLASQAKGTELIRFDGVNGDAVAASPAGQFFAYSTPDSVVIRTQPAPWTEIAALDGSASGLTFSDDDSLLATANKEGVQIISTSSWEIQQRWPKGSYPFQFSPDGKWFVFREGDHLHLVDRSSMKTVKRLETRVFGTWWHQRKVIDFSNDGEFLIFPDGNRKWKLFYLESQKTSDRLSDVVPMGTSVSLSPDAEFVCVGGPTRGPDLEVWHLATLEKKRTLKKHRFYVTRVEYTADGRYLVSSSGDQSLNVWDAGNYEHVQTLQGHLGEIWEMATSADGRQVISACNAENASVRIWQIGNKTARGETYVAGTPFAAISPVEVVYTLDREGHVRKLSADQDRVRPLFSFEDVEVAYVGTGIPAAGCSCDGSQLVFGMVDGTVRIWNTHKQQFEQDLPVQHDGYVRAVKFHPKESATIALGTTAGSVVIWDLVLPQIRTVLPKREGPIRNLSFSPSGNRIAVSSAEKKGRRLTVYELSDQVRQLYSINVNCDTSEFSPDGTQVAIGSGSDVLVFDAASGERINRFQGHGAGVHSIVYSPDGRTLITSCADQSIKFWHLATGTEMISLRTTALPVVKLMRRPGLSRLVIGSRTIGTVRTIKVPGLEHTDSLVH